MLNFLENVVKDYEEGEVGFVLESLQEAEYDLREIEERGSVDQELLELVEDIVYAHKQKNYDDALLYTKMAIDVATLSCAEGYRYNKVGFETVQTELDEHVNTPIDADNVTEHIEWDMKYRKLKGRLTKLLIVDHRARFGKYALLD